MDFGGLSCSCALVSSSVAPAENSPCPSSAWCCWCEHCWDSKVPTQAQRCSSPTSLLLRVDRLAYGALPMQEWQNIERWGNILLPKVQQKLFTLMWIFLILLLTTSLVFTQEQFISVSSSEEKKANQSNPLKAKIKPVNIVIDPGIFWTY